MDGFNLGVNLNYILDLCAAHPLLLLIKVVNGTCQYQDHGPMYHAKHSWRYVGAPV